MSSYQDADSESTKLSGPTKQLEDPSLAKRALNDASATAGQSADGADVPTVAAGDDERPIDEGLNDLGWSEDPKVPTPMMHGMRNEDVWQLVRRFNKQTYHIKTIKERPQGGIDMNIADKDAFTPDKLRSTLERMYMTIGLGLAGFVKHIARVRSWKERRRTGAFFVGFVGAWLLNVVVPAFLSLIVVLIASPMMRKILFPPAPLSAISASTGQAKVPKAGHLGSDGLTGAAESYKGEAVEQEASNLVGSVAHMAVSTAIGNDASKVQKYDEVENDIDDDEANDASTQSLPDPAAGLALTGKDAQSKASGDKKHDDKQDDASAEPVSKSVWDGAQPLLHALEDAADTWERFANALAPTPPFAQRGPRMQMAAIVAPFVLVSAFVTIDMVYRGTTLIAGLLFFGQPVLDHLKVSAAKEWLDKNIPDWQRYLELRNSVLKGVPTDAQLTLTLLRIGEAHKSPLPPPPPAARAPPPTAKDGTMMVQDVPEEYKDDLQNDVHRNAQEETGKNDADAAAPKKQSKIMAFLKGSTRAGANTALGANYVKAEAGFERAKQKVGVVQAQPSPEAMGDGPASFHARFKGKRGLVLISTTATTPCVSFEREWPAHAKAAQIAYTKAKEVHERQQQGDGDKGEGGGDGDEPDALRMLRDVAEKARPTPAFSLQIDDITSLRKLGGLGWKAKLVVGWAMGSEVEDGLEIITTDGQTHTVTAMPRRDEVFNRLAAMSKDHVWEAW